MMSKKQKKGHQKFFKSRWAPIYHFPVSENNPVHTYYYYCYYSTFKEQFTYL